jgi:hypothetical protein
VVKVKFMVSGLCHVVQCLDTIVLEDGAASIFRMPLA